MTVSSNPAPTAIQLIAPVVAADRGRERARTLLFLHGAGVDYVDTHLDDLEVALGQHNPGRYALTALIVAARAAASPLAPRVPKQHLISQTLLARWTEPVPGKPGAGRRLKRHDLVRGVAMSYTTGQIGYARNFVKIDSARVEGVWQRVENELTLAIAAAGDGSLASRPDMQQVLRDAIALHFARNGYTRDLHFAMWRDVRDRRAKEIAASPFAEEAFRRHYGVPPATQEDRRLGADIVLQRLSQAEDDGVLFRLVVEDRFDRVCDLLAAASLEVITPADPADEFVIGDLPAVTIDAATGAVGARQGVTLTGADTVLLPLGPRLLVALGPHLRFAAVPAEMVTLLNRAQIEAAESYVYYRPRAAVGRLITSWRPPSSPTPSQPPIPLTR